MAVYRSAQGKMVDMAALISKNQKTRAVGNMKVNARGDSIDSFGKVIQPVTEKVNTRYSKTVGNRGAHAVKQNQKQKPVQEDLTNFEKELSNELEDDEKDLEVLKQKEKGK